MAEQMTKTKRTGVKFETPDLTVSARETFGIDCDWSVPAFSEMGDHVPDIDQHYVFDPDTTMAILAGFLHNRRVMIQGLHGTGKSSHIEQIAARLNWPCIRINLDSQITRTDLLGRDALIADGHDVITSFNEGLLPYALRNPCALVFDEYDAGRPDVLFVIQRILEQDGKLTLLESNQVITPHPFFRLFATANTLGLGDSTGLYQGTQVLNQGQLDRWHVVSTLNGLPPEREISITLAKVSALNTAEGRDTVKNMVMFANLTRTGFEARDISQLMSPRTVLSWAENFVIFGDLDRAFRLSFYNKVDVNEHAVLDEYYQRCFGRLPR
jgi:cobaltochelatase CobS